MVPWCSFQSDPVEMAPRGLSPRLLHSFFGAHSSGTRALLSESSMPLREERERKRRDGADQRGPWSADVGSDVRMAPDLDPVGESTRPTFADVWGAK